MSAGKGEAAARLDQSERSSLTRTGHLFYASVPVTLLVLAAQKSGSKLD
jgi:hypothetical protein